MKIKVAQLAIGRDISRNQAKVLEVLEAVEAGEWVVFPEGTLSGYFPGQSGFLHDVAPASIDRALDEIAARVQDRGCRCILGSATCAGGAWRNSAIVLGPAGERLVYHKRALSALDQRHFVPGKDPLVATWNGVTLGVLICRELILPELWAGLKWRGAHIAFHVNNAIKPVDRVWRHLLIARAVENGFFVCSANAVGPPESLGSFLVSPRGEVLLGIAPQLDRVVGAEVDLTQIVDDFS